MPVAIDIGDGTGTRCFNSSNQFSTRRSSEAELRVASSVPKTMPMKRPSGRMSQARGSRDTRSPVTLAGNRTGGPNLTPPAVVTLTATICAVAAAVNTSSSPVADHTG